MLLVLLYVLIHVSEIAFWFSFLESNMQFLSDPQSLVHRFLLFELILEIKFDIHLVKLL